MEDAMHRLNLRRFTYAAFTTALLTAAIAAPVRAQETGSRAATISYAVPPVAALPAEPLDFEGLTLASDFTVFMRDGVPDDVRLAALRRLWVLMALPVSCQELCADPQSTGGATARVASESPPIAVR
jgi:hypothetical protein